MTTTTHSDDSGDSSNKVDRYDWSKIGSRGDDRWVPIDDLRVDHAYQRGIVSDNTVLEIAKAFSWDAFGVIVAAERDNGHLYILDGQQRWEGAKRRGDIKRVPCKIFKSEGRAWEAKVFRTLNMNRRPVTAIEKFRSAVIAGMDPDRGIQKWLDSEGVRICKNAAAGAREIDFVDGLRRAWVADQEAARRALLIHFDIVGEDRSSRDIFAGVWYCESNGVSVTPHVEKMRSQGGRAFVLSYIKKTCIEYGIGAGSLKTCGIGTLRAINWHRSAKIRFPKNESSGESPKEEQE